MFRSVTPFGSHALQGERNDPFGSLQRLVIAAANDPPAPQDLEQRFGEQLVLGVEVGVESAGRETGLGHDVVDAAAGKALPPKHHARRRQDALARGMLVIRRVSHGGDCITIVILCQRGFSAGFYR